MRRIFNVHIENLLREDSERAVEIARLAFGDGYLTKEELLGWMEDDRFVILKAVGTTDDGHEDVAGFAIGCCMWKEDATSFLHVNDDIFGVDDDSDSIGIVKMTAVNPDFQGQRVGSMLVRDLLESMRMIGAGAYACVAWRQNNGVENIEPLISKLGFKSKMVINDYWYEDSIKEGYICPADGNPCHCSADIWIKKTK